MLAIQNQISVLTKILETKMQQQQILQYQQAVSANFAKTVSAGTMQQHQQRSRKISSNSNNNGEGGTSQCGESQEELKLNDSSSGVSNVKQTNKDIVEEDNMIPESTACVIS